MASFLTPLGRLAYLVEYNIEFRALSVYVLCYVSSSALYVCVFVLADISVQCAQTRATRVVCRCTS